MFGVTNYSISSVHRLKHQPSNFQHTKCQHSIGVCLQQAEYVCSKLSFILAERIFACKIEINLFRKSIRIDGGGPNHPPPATSLSHPLLSHLPPSHRLRFHRLPYTQSPFSAPRHTVFRPLGTLFTAPPFYSVSLVYYMLVF